jgi:DnaJ family protein C protein 13
LFFSSPGSGKVLASYYYKDIESLAELTDYPGGFAVVKADFGRMHLFASEAREEIIRRMQEEAANHTGLTLRRKQVSFAAGGSL